MGVLVLPLYRATLGLKGNVAQHKNMLCEDQPSMQQISPTQPGITSKTNNRAAFKMNFRFQDEKETQGHELLGDTCSEQGPMPKKGPKEEPENRRPKGRCYIHSSIHKLSLSVCRWAWLCIKQQACDNEWVSSCHNRIKGAKKWMQNLHTSDSNERNILVKTRDNSESICTHGQQGAWTGCHFLCHLE